MVIKLEDETLLEPLKRVMQSLFGVTDVAVHKEVKARDVIYSKLLARLDELSKLQNNWDDDGALPMEPEVVKNVKKMIEKSKNGDLNEWTIFPDINGTILLENQKDTVISIGNTEFSYTSPHSKGSRIKFTPSVLLKTIREINEK
ncbi:MAG: hypothetical protein K6F33_12560 [Bacteroidales bacterium]|nr:hypothetical protein [Bacteroidales bacterium]